MKHFIPKIRGETKSDSKIKIIRSVSILLILFMTITLLPVLNSNNVKAITNSEIVSSGKVADISFSGTTATNVINNKAYTLGSYGGIGTGSGVSTPYGNGIQFSGGQYEIPVADLGISDSSTSELTISFDLQNGNQTTLMPVGFAHYTEWLYSGNYGFNSDNTDLYGTGNTLSSTSYTHIIAIFNKGNYTLNNLYMNGVSQPLSQKVGSQSTGNDSSWGTRLCISGYTSSINYRLNGATMTNIEIWNRALTSIEASTIYAESLVKKAQNSDTSSDISAAAAAVRLLPSRTDKTNLQTELNMLIKPTVTSSLQTDHNHLSFGINDTSQNYTYKLYKKNVTSGETSFTGEGDFPYSGMTGDFNFDDGTAYNAINNKDYTIGAYGATGGGGSEVSTPYGSGINFTNGQIQIPTSDLQISDDSTSEVTVSFDLNINSSEPTGITPIGFTSYCSRINPNNNLGFNTANSDIYGKSGVPPSNTYNHYTFVFYKGDYTKGAMYINGIRQPLSQQSTTQNVTNSSTWGNYLCISGWSGNAYSRITSSTITGVKVWNRALSDTEIENVYNYSNGLSTPSATFLTDKTFTGDSRDYINLGQTNFNFSNGVNATYSARWDALNQYSRIFDLGLSFVNANYINTNSFMSSAYPSDETANNIIVSNAITVGSMDTWKVHYNSSGIASINKDGIQIETGSSVVPRNGLNTFSTIGKTHGYPSDGDGMFQGEIKNLVLSTYATSYDDYMIQDTTTPTAPTVSYSHEGHQAQFSLNSTSSGNTYQYYVVATGDDGKQYTSNTVTFNGLKNNISSYNYTINQTATGTVTSSNSSQNLLEQIYQDENFSKGGNYEGDNIGSDSSYSVHVVNDPQAVDGKAVEITVLKDISSWSYAIFPWSEISVSPNTQYTCSIRYKVLNIIPNSGSNSSGKLSLWSHVMDSSQNLQSYADNVFYSGGVYNSNQYQVYNQTVTTGSSSAYQTFALGTGAVKAGTKFRIDYVTYAQGSTALTPNTTNTGSINQIEPSGNYYIHINAVSPNGAVSSTADSGFALPIITPSIASTYVISSNSTNVVCSINDSTQNYNYTIQNGGTQIYSGTGTSYTDTSAKDSSPPNAITAVTQTNLGTTTSAQQIGLSWSAASDNGTSYNYIVTANGQTDGQQYTSSSTTLTCTSGIKEYWWSIDTSSTGTPTGNNTTSASSLSVNPLSLGLTPGKNYYFHVLAVDNAGNKSSTYTQQITIPAIINETVNTSTISLGHVNMLSTNSELDNAFTVTTDSNTTYYLSMQANSALKGSVGTINENHILVRVHGTQTFLPVSSNGKITLLNNQMPTNGATVSLDLIFSDDWLVTPDSYSVTLNVVSSQNP